ncbi:hypothetical protein [Mesorhizobium sp.]|uniref:hypothetical protein n=1 Tax=Mesorhizobium sp. TaxID=1871066 RepID=UPI000FE2C545|nr:hypothetical protein [Mesorhizobium sp.]RWN51903.1 MAG: hypothetical protein EOR98_23915 [Mesorhizobium sp.]RWN73087.1 MAG: hypothetical protein EOS02_25680 [Mesorhizobium sp.]RWN76270.1 MAG: hypothetical protein EOS01_21400 [Mesorhizobium sp.]RWN86017.1 MAG: hypothetical protein EOS04_20800 [Mesorhizobium sp.]RWO11781.1 MAG: hypothetical protein EOS15_22025 [Mesorhizobium sp.]
MSAYLLNVDRNAFAKVFAADRNAVGISGLPETPFETAEEAFKAAVAMRDTGDHPLVRVWVEGAGMVDFPQIEELLEYWTNNPE